MAGKDGEEKTLIGDYGLWSSLIASQGSPVVTRKLCTKRRKAEEKKKKLESDLGYVISRACLGASYSSAFIFLGLMICYSGRPVVPDIAVEREGLLFSTYFFLLLGDKAPIPFSVICPSIKLCEILV